MQKIWSWWPSLIFNTHLQLSRNLHITVKRCMLAQFCEVILFKTYQQELLKLDKNFCHVLLHKYKIQISRPIPIFWPRLSQGSLQKIYSRDQGLVQAPHPNTGREKHYNFYFIFYYFQIEEAEDVEKDRRGGGGQVKTMASFAFIRHHGWRT